MLASGPSSKLGCHSCGQRVPLTITHSEFVEAVELMESYIFRRSVLDLETRSLGRIFATLAFELDSDRVL
jgi:hypothetical protein